MALAFPLNFNGSLVAIKPSDLCYIYLSMAKKKSSKRLPFTTLNIVIVGFILLIISILLFINLAHRNKQDSSSKQVAPTNQITSEEKSTSYSEAQLSSIEGAKTIAHSFFEAIKECDVEKANSYRLAPNKTTEQNKVECRKSCPSGFLYTYTELITFDDHPVDGNKSEVVSFRYGLRCSTATRSLPVTVQMTKYEDKWYILTAIPLGFL